MPQTLQKVQKIKDLFPISNGLFNHMNYTFRAEVSKSSLDVMFLANYGKRNPSPVVELVQSEYGEALTSANLTQLATIIEEMYSEKWDKMGAIYDIQYDPIHNYLDEWEDDSEENVDGESTKSGTDTTTYGKTASSTSTRTDNLTSETSATEDNTRTRTDNLTETETHNLEDTVTRTDNLSEEMSYGKTDTRTDNLTEELSKTVEVEGSGSVDNTIFGFNTATAVGTDGSSTSDTKDETTTSTIENTGTQTNVTSGDDTRTNTGTRTTVDEDTGTLTTTNTGTETTVDDKESSVTVEHTGTQTTGILSSTGGSDSVSKSGSTTEDVTTTKSRSGSHSGNIGNLTSQKMIIEEINLWKWNYMQEILNDVKEFCTLPIYLNATEYVLVDQDD